MATVEMLKHLPPPPLPVIKPPSSVTFNIGKEELCLDRDVNDLFLLACFMGDTDLIQRPLDLGADVNAKHKNTESTALITAAQCGHDSVVEMLCKIKGIDKKSRNCRNKSALYYAIRMGSPPMIECLCEELANINGDVLPGVSAKDLAIACGGNPRIVSSLCDYGVSRDKNDKTSKTPLGTPKIYKQVKPIGLLEVPAFLTGNKTKTVRQPQRILKPGDVSRKKGQDEINEGYDFVSLDRPNSVHDHTQVGTVSEDHLRHNNSVESPVNPSLIDTGKENSDKGDCAVPEVVGNVSPSDSLEGDKSDVPPEVGQRRQGHSSTLAIPRSKPRKCMKSPTDVPGAAVSSELDNTKPQSDTGIAKERHQGRLQCAHLEENHVVAETFPEEKVTIRKNPGRRRGAKAVIGQLPQDMPVCYVITKHVYKYYSPVQQTIQKAINVGIKSKMNITGGGISSSDSNSPCSTYTSCSNVSSGRSHLLDSSSIASLPE